MIDGPRQGESAELNLSLSDNLAGSGNSILTSHLAWDVRLETSLCSSRNLRHEALELFPRGSRGAPLLVNKVVSANVRSPRTWQQGRFRCDTVEMLKQALRSFSTKRPRALG